MAEHRDRQSVATTEGTVTFQVPDMIVYDDQVAEELQLQAAARNQLRRRRASSLPDLRPDVATTSRSTPIATSRPNMDTSFIEVNDKEDFLRLWEEWVAMWRTENNNDQRTLQPATGTELGRDQGSQNEATHSDQRSQDVGTQSQPQ